MKKKHAKGEFMDIVVYPNEILKKVAVRVEKCDENIKKIAKEMTQAMYDNGGVGLAAPQVGLSMQIIVINPTNEPEKEQVYLNPVILKKKGREAKQEGCLSFPKIFGDVVRATWIQVSAMLLSGETVVFEAEGFTARVLQHEIDHLNGILFVEKLQPADKVVVKKDLRNLELAAEKRKKK